MKTHRNSTIGGVALVTLGIVGLPGLGGGADETKQRQVPVKLIARPAKESFQVGEAILVVLKLQNGFGGTIRFSTFALEPNEWNGETAGCGPVDIYRDGKQFNLFSERPKVEPPSAIAGMRSYPIDPGAELQVRLDLSKWPIRDGGWKPGKYEVTLRAQHVILDSYVTGSVLSDPIQFEVRGQ